MNAKVLFIDDEAPVREMFQRLFQESNYEIFLAKNGQEGISIFEKEFVTGDHNETLALITRMLKLAS